MTRLRTCSIILDVKAFIQWYFLQCLESEIAHDINCLLSSESQHLISLVLYWNCKDDLEEQRSIHAPWQTKKQEQPLRARSASGTPQPVISNCCNLKKWKALCYGCRLENQSTSSSPLFQGKGLCHLGKMVLSKYHKLHNGIVRLRVTQLLKAAHLIISRYLDKHGTLWGTGLLQLRKVPQCHAYFWLRCKRLKAGM